MAAWLAYLKSRLLLPETGTEEEPSGAERAAALKFQMQRLQAMRDAGEKLILLPRLGHDIFPRGTPERPRTRTTTTYDATLFDLLKAYGRQRAKGGPPNLQIRRTELYSVDQAVARLTAMLGAVPGWRRLASFLPRDPPERPPTRPPPTKDATLFDWLKAYGRQRAKGGPQNLQIRRTELYAVDQAVARLTAMLGAVPGWRTLASFLPRDLQRDPLLKRSALASTFAATLEMCKAGKLRIRQEDAFGPIFLRSAAEEKQIGRAHV